MHSNNFLCVDIVCLLLLHIHLNFLKELGVGEHLHLHFPFCAALYKMLPGLDQLHIY